MSEYIKMNDALIYNYQKDIIDEKGKEIERLNNIINEAQKKIDEILNKPSNVLQYVDLKEFKDILEGSDKE